MKILQINKLYYPWIGGVEKIVQQIAEGLNNKNDFKVDVLVCNSEKKRITERINGVEVFRAKTIKIMLGMPISLDFLILYRNLVKNYDLIFLHYPFPLGFLSYFLFSRNKELLIWYHSDIVRQKFLEIFFKFFHLYALNKARKIFVSNPNLIESSNYLKKFKEKCTVIPFGIDFNYFKEDEDIKKQAEEIKKKFGAPIILSVGRLSYYKGFEYLIETAKNIEAKFIIIGEGTLKHKLLKMIKDLKLDNKVFLIPPVSDLRPFYSACDIFILPSIHKSEAFGIVILEAMAFGKPIISTELGTGTSWINLNGKTGLVVPPKNPEKLKEAINELLNKEDFKRILGENARKRAQEFSLDNFIKKISSEIKSL